MPTPKPAKIWQPVRLEIREYIGTASLGYFFGVLELAHPWSKPGRE